MYSGNLLGSRAGRLATFGILYISEGIPLGFAGIAMAVYMRRQGLANDQIGQFLATFYLPWAFKWAWAPVVDLVRLERYGGRKAWIAVCQVVMILTLVAMGRTDYAQHFQLLIALVVLHNVFSATQDIAIDALAVNALREDERATANGAMFAGSFIGQGLGGSGALFVSERWGFDVSFLYVSLLLSVILGFVLLFVQDPSLVRHAGQRAADAWSAIVARVRDFLRELASGLFRSGVGPMAGVVFALLPMGAMALSSAVSGALQVDIGMNDDQIGTLNLYQTILAAAGCVVGGWVADRLGQRKMLAVWYLLTVLPTLYLAFVISAGGGIKGLSIAQYSAAALVFAWCTGMQYGTSAAVFMGLTNPLVAATQFTGYMAIKNLAMSYTNLWQGALADAQGYAAVLYVDALLGALPVLLIPFLKPSTRATQQRASDDAPLTEAG